MTELAVRAVADQLVGFMAGFVVGLLAIGWARTALRRIERDLTERPSIDPVNRRG